MAGENVMSIPLPPKYALLERFFNAVESSLYCQKKTAVDFDTLRAAVEVNVRKTFTEELFGKLLTIYPKSYIVSRHTKDNTLLISLPSRSYTGELGAAQHSLTRRKTFKEKLVQLLLVTDKIISQPMPSRIGAASPENQVDLKDRSERPGLDLDAVKALRNSTVPSKRKFANVEVEGAKEASAAVVGAKENKRRNVPAGLKGLPLSLIDSIRARKEREQLLDPKVQAERQRVRMVETLPAVFDMVYFHFKSNKKLKSDVDKLAESLAQTQGT